MKFVAESLADTKLLAEKLAKKAPHVLALEGDLGSGKTTLAAYYAKALGVTERLNSPTFVIAKEYEEADLVHLDLYRLQDVEELYDIDFQDYLLRRHVIIEWPEVARELLPEDSLWLSITQEGDKRVFAWEEL